MKGISGAFKRGVGPKERLFILRGLQRLRWRRKIPANAEGLLLVFTTTQCISINVRSCVFTGSAWPLLFIQLCSTPANHSPLWDGDPCYAEPHWLCCVSWHVWVLLFLFHQQQPEAGCRSALTFCSGVWIPLPWLVYRTPRSAPSKVFRL